MKEDQERVRFDYIKSNFFRVIHTTGAIGGLTPRGEIHMALFNERAAIPQQVVYAVENGQIGDELKEEKVGRESIVREVECDLQMDLSTASVLHKWLGERIQELNKSVIKTSEGSSKTKKKSQVKKPSSARVRSKRKKKP